MPGFSSELSIPYGGFALRPTEEIKIFKATSSCEDDNRGDGALITNPFQFLSLSPFIASTENDKQDNYLVQKQQSNNDEASMIDIKLPVVTKLESDEPVCDPELESNGKPNTYDGASSFGSEKKYILNGPTGPMWDESSGKQFQFVIPEARCQYPDSSLSSTLSPQSHIPTYYSSKKDFENYLKRQQLNINLSRNGSVDASALRDSPQKTYPASLKIPPRVLHETRCKSMDEFTTFVKYMTPDKRLLFENKYQLSPGTLDAVPYVATTPTQSSLGQNEGSNFGDDIRSLLSSLSIATSNSTVSTPLSAHEAPKMINTFDTGSFDKDVSSSGLLENPFVDSVANNFKSEAVRKTSDLNNNLASLLYSNLPYFQAFMMLQNQQCMINMATSVASSGCASTNDASNTSGNFNSHDQSFMQSANSILRNMNFNYALFNELISQQHQPQQQQLVQGQQSPSFSAYQSHQCNTLNGHSPGLLPTADEKDAYKSGHNHNQSVFAGQYDETEAGPKSALVSPNQLHGFAQSSADLYNTYLSMLSSVNLNSDGVKDLLAASANNKSANCNNGLMSKPLLHPNKRSQHDFVGTGLNNRGAYSKMPNCASSWLNYSQSSHSQGSKQPSARSNNSFGANSMNKTNGGNRYKQQGNDAMLMPSCGSVGMHGNDQQHHNHNRQHGYQSSGARNRATDMLLANVALAVEQYKAIENERKKTEVALSHLFPSHDMRSDNGRSSQTPRLPPNPTRVDRLVGEMQKEQPKRPFAVHLDGG
ncbi:uncharacterized protein LOC142334680 isoform X2 [Convolutriloba macropyga]|uniref:uncharacterized protein LOC142334680 isoform X2 n=1 Tax=Convolutriloba macropyga TaxID=536237 RepID=UPI003F51EF0D